jgi:hypothetical protein
MPSSIISPRISLSGGDLNWAQATNGRLLTLIPNVYSESRSQTRPNYELMNFNVVDPHGTGIRLWMGAVYVVRTDVINAADRLD